MTQVLNGTSGQGRGTAQAYAYSPVQIVAGVFGAVFLLVGVLGFVPGITSQFSDLSFAGHESHAKLLGLFQVSVLHNVVHLLFGVAGLLVFRDALRSGQYLIFGGATYLALTAYGFLIDQNSAINFVPINTADNFLHLALGVAMTGLGVALSRSRSARRRG